VLVSLVVPDLLEAGCTTRRARKEAPPARKEAPPARKEAPPARKEAPPQQLEYELTVLGRTLPEPPAAGCAWATEHP
jgi:hypothetical protein